MLEIVLIVLLITLIVIALIILYYIRHPKLHKKQRKPIVPPKYAKPSREILRELSSKFEAYYHRKPNSNELVRLIIMTSHIVIRGNSLWAHWMRYKIRLFLAAENGVWYGAKPVNAKTLDDVFGTAK
jgi:hypothetical protein